MENFIREENLRLYRKALHESSDVEQRRMIKNLLRQLLEEQAALKVHVRKTVSIAPEIS
jgi:stress-induced morphogen